LLFDHLVHTRGNQEAYADYGAARRLAMSSSSGH